MFDDKHRHRIGHIAGLVMANIWFIYAASALLAVNTPDYDDSLHTYQQLRQRADQLIRDKIHTINELDEYKRKVRERFQDVLGPWPTRTPLQAVKVGVLNREGYTIEKIIIQSQPGFYVPINLYVPKGWKPPLPAVLCPEGHAPKGKAHDVYDNYQARFITLAKKGYIVLAFDPLGQGEREPYGAATGNNHHIQGYQCMPTGRHLANYFLWDCIRCIDYLESRPEVDKSRIACSGCSGGGAMTTYLIAVDDRISLAAPASYVAESLALTQDKGLHVESWFPDVCGPYGPGTVQLLTCMSPKPLQILVNKFDGEFPPESAHPVFQEVRKSYLTSGAADRIEYAEVPTPHGYWPEARREFYQFLNKWFDNTTAGNDEPPVEMEAEEDLWCAPDGQVRNLPGAHTVYSLNQLHMAELRKGRAELRQRLSPEEYRQHIRQAVINVAVYEPTTDPLNVRYLNRQHTDYGTLTQMFIEYEPGFWSPADLYQPQTAVTKALVLTADDNAKASAWAMTCCTHGLPVLHLHSQKTADRLEIMAGRPRAGLWAKALVSGAKFLNAQAKLPTTHVYSTGIGWTAALAAQFAALFEPEQFAGVIAIGGLNNMESLADDIDCSHSLQMLPQALRWFDEEDLLAAISPKPMFIASVVDKTGAQLNTDQLAARYGWAMQRRPAGIQTICLHSSDPTAVELKTWIDR